MGNYLSNLGKGFVRSAVNQVGRDAGRVVSNQTFGDAHSTPIRGVGNGTPPPLANNAMPTGNSDFEYVPETTTNRMIAWIVAIVLTFGLAAVICFFKSISSYNKKTIRYRRYEVGQEAIIDRRYRNNVRGYQTVQGYKYYDVPTMQANPNDVKKHKKNAMILMIISGVVLLIAVNAIVRVSENRDAKKQNTEVVSNAPSTTDSVK